MSSYSDPTKLATSTIPKFDSTNYKVWTDSLRSFLRYNGLWFLIEGYSSAISQKQSGMSRPTVSTTPTPTEITAQATWDEKNDKVLGSIQLYVAQNLHHMVDNEYLTAIAWKKITDEYEKPRVVGAFVAFQQFIGLHMSDALALGPQIDSIIEKAVQVNTAGIELKEQLVALAIVNALPKSYQLLSSTILATVDLTTLKPATVWPKIVEEEQWRLANKVRVSRVSKASQLGTKCEKCGCNSHTTEQHWNKKPSGSAQPQSQAGGSGGGQTQGQVQGEGGGKKKQAKKAKKQQNNTATVATVNTLEIVSIPNVPVVSSSESITISLYTVGVNSARWMLNSGCNCHVTPVKSDFMHYHDFPTPEYIKTASQSQLIEIKGYRTVYVEYILENGDKRTLMLSEVLYVSQASTRFFAPSVPIKLGHYAKITAEKFYLYHKLPKADSSPQLIFSGLRNKMTDLYWLQASVLAKAKLTSHIMSANSSFDLWHHCFGHTGKKALEQLPGHVSGVSDKIRAPAALTPCDGCEFGKSKRNPFLISDSYSEHILDLVHMDLVEFLSLSIESYKFTLTILDDYLSMGLSFFLKRKSDAFASFKAYVAWAEIQTGRKLKAIRLD